MMAVEFITLASAILCSINVRQDIVVCFMRYNLKGHEPAVERTVWGVHFWVPAIDNSKTKQINKLWATFVSKWTLSQISTPQLNPRIQEMKTEMETGKRVPVDAMRA